MLFACGGGSSSGESAAGGSGTIRGKVTISGMSDLSNCVIKAELNSAGRTASVNRTISSGISLSENTTEGDGVYVTLTDSEGNYSLTGLPDGIYTVTAEKANTLGAVMPNILLNQLESSSTVTLDIVLTATGSISGTATLIDSSSAYGTFVYAAGTSYVAAADADGNFTISNIPIGTYTIVYYHAGYVTQTETNVVVTAANNSELFPVVLDPESQQTKPFVVYTNPTANETGVSRVTPINIVFSMKMNEATITSDNIQVKDSANNIVNGTLSYSNSVALFVPGGALNRNVKYTVTISPLVENSAGVAMGYEHNVYFTTNDTLLNFTVSFNKNDVDAEGTMGPQVITEGASENLKSCTFTKSDYHFAGWSTTPGGEVEYTNGASFTMGAKNIELFARWRDNSFDSAANVGDPVTITVGSETVKMIYANNQESITFPLSTSMDTPDDTGKATLVRKFFMSETEVTNAQFAKVLQWAYDNGKISETDTNNNVGEYSVTYIHQVLIWLSSPYLKIRYSTSTHSFSVDSGYENYPVNTVTWYGAIMFCNWLTEMRDGNTSNVVYTGIGTSCIEDSSKTGYRLPSREEWEYAARYIGTTAPAKGNLAVEYIAQNHNGGHADLTPGYYWTPAAYASGAIKNYNNETETRECGWYPGDPEMGGTDQIMPIAQKKPNQLGFYDISGNVTEFCSQLVRLTYSEARGGSYSLSVEYLMLGKSSPQHYTGATKYNGFRFVRTK